MVEETKQERKNRLKAENRERMKSVSGPAHTYEPFGVGHLHHSVGNGIKVAVPRKKYSGHKTRTGAWDECQVGGCGKPTASGLKEKDLAKRFCRRHLPSMVAIFQDETSRSKQQSAPCYSDQKAKTCRHEPIVNHKPCSLGFGRFGRCLIPIFIDGLYSGRRCFVRHEIIEYQLVPTLRWGRYWYYDVKGGEVVQLCTYLPHIRWNRKRVPFVFGTDRGPRNF